MISRHIITDHLLQVFKTAIIHGLDKTQCDTLKFSHQTEERGTNEFVIHYKISHKMTAYANPIKLNTNHSVQTFDSLDTTIVTSVLYSNYKLFNQSLSSLSFSPLSLKEIVLINTGYFLYNHTGNNTPACASIEFEFIIPYVLN